MQKKSELPEGWKSVSLGELVQPSKEKIEPSENPNLKYVGLEHIESHKCQIKGHGFSVDIKSTKTVFHRGDILYGKLRPYLNKVCVPNFDGVCSTDILVFNSTSSLNNYYLMRFLSTPDVVDYTSNNSSGVQLPRINFQKLSSYTVPLPPLAEQHRIVLAIEALFARLDATNEKLDRVPEILKKFRQSVLAAACDGRLTEEWRRENLGTVSVINLPEVGAILRKNSIKDGKKEIQKLNTDGLKKIPEQWIWINFSRLICEVKRGPSKKCNQNEEGIRYITSGNIHDGKLRLDTDNKYLSNFDDIEKCRLKPQDLILNCVNSLDKIGKTCVYPELEDEAIIGFNNYALELETEVVSPQLINYFCQTDDFKSQLNLLVKHAVNQVSFAKLELDYIAVPLPHLPEQQEIVRRVDALFAFADSIEAKVAAAREKTEKLRQSILAKAFSGQLVETEAEIARREGRDYETAEVLLEKIKVEKGKRRKK